MMNRLKLYNKFRGAEVKAEKGSEKRSKDSSSHDLAKRQQIGNSTSARKILVRSDSDLTDGKSVGKSGVSADANELVKAIDDQISEELASKDLSSDLKVLPSFDGTDAKMKMAFAPTLPLYAMRQQRAESLKSLEEDDEHESPEVIMIDTTSKRKKPEERRQAIQEPVSSKWQLGFVSHNSETVRGSDSPAKEDVDMEQPTLLSRLQIRS